LLDDGILKITFQAGGEDIKNESILFDAFAKRDLEPDRKAELVSDLNTLG
jgi:hypothetical protein